MPSTSTQYGNYNPAAVDPFPIESTLAPLAASGNPLAFSLLNLYQDKNAAAANVYGQELDTQHQFAKQQLGQQLYEANLKALPEIAKAPGLAGLAARSPTYQGVFGGADPDAIAQFVGAADRSTAATDFEHSGAGLASTTAAGFQPSSEQAALATGGIAGPQGDPTTIAAAKIRANAQIAAAKIHAASAAGGVAPGESVEITNKFGLKETLTRKKGMSDDQWDAFVANKGNVVPVDPSARPSQVQPPGATAPVQPQAGRGAPTNLPMAQTDTPSPAATQPSSGAATQSNTGQGNAEKSQRTLQWIDANSSRIPKEIANDIKNGARQNGGIVRFAANGHPVGASGNVY